MTDQTDDDDQEKPLTFAEEIRRQLTERRAYGKARAREILFGTPVKPETDTETEDENAS